MLHRIDPTLETLTREKPTVHSGKTKEDKSVSVSTTEVLKMPPPMITLEEHFLSKAAKSDSYTEQFKALPYVSDQLYDVGPIRLEEMDKGGVSLQIVSHAPGELSAAQCTAANDQLASDISKHPSRFAGFAVLPVNSPSECPGELERVVRTHGFVGALIDNHSNGKFYDGDEYLPMWEMAERLDVPVYLHPTWPSEDMLPKYAGNFSQGAAASMGTSGWGWHSDTALHVLRLYASNLFDKCPKLKIIVGHMGEGLPFFLDRICQLSVRWGERKRLFKQVYRENIWITTSGVWSLDPMRCILANTPIDHILHSVDYPFAKNEWGLKWMQDFEESELVTREQLEMIAYRNAEKLLGVKAPARE